MVSRLKPFSGGDRGGHFVEETGHGDETAVEGGRKVGALHDRIATDRRQGPPEANPVVVRVWLADLLEAQAGEARLSRGDHVVDGVLADAFHYRIAIGRIHGEGFADQFAAA